MTLRASLIKALAGGRKRLAGKLAAFQKQASAADDAAAVQKVAELVTANVYRWPAGEASLECDDWDTGSPVTVTIADPDAGPVACAKKLYARAAKQRRAAEQLAPLVAEAESGLTYLGEVAESLVTLDRCAPVFSF